MKKIFILLILNCFISVVGFAQGSVVLDLSNSDGTKAFVLPRVATTASIVTPLNGMLIYDISSNCIKAYQNNVWSSCLGAATTPVGTDYLRSALAAGGCTSCVLYDAAAVNTWINITAAEYAQIDNYMSVNLAGSAESVLTAPFTIFGNALGLVSTGTNTATLPANNYVVGFSAVLGGAVGSVSGSYLKYSTNSGTGFTMSGPSLYISSTSTAGNRIYNILKQPPFVVSSSATYVGIYVGGNTSVYIGYITGGTSTWTNGADNTNLNTSTGAYTVQYQVKGTALKRW